MSSQETSTLESDPWYSALALNDKVSSCFKRETVELEASVLPIFRMIGLRASQKIVRYVTKNREFSKIKLVDALMNVLNDPEIKENRYMQREALDVILSCIDLIDSYSLIHPNALSYICFEPLQPHLDAALAGISGAEKSFKGSLKVLIHLETLRKIADVFEKTMNKSLRVTVDENRFGSMVRVRALFESYLSILKAISKESLSHDHASVRNFSCIVLENYQNRLSGIWEQLKLECDPEERWSSATHLVPELTAFGSNLMQLNTVVIRSYSDLFQSVKASMSVVIDALAFKNGIALKYHNLPEHIKVICGQIQRVIAGEADAGMQRKLIHPELLNAVQDVNGRTGQVVLRMMYGYSLLNYTVLFSVLGNMRGKKAESIEIEGKIYGFGNESGFFGDGEEWDLNFNANELLIYILSLFFGTNGLAIDEYDAFELNVLPGCVQFRWKIPLDGLTRSQGNEFYRFLQNIADFLNREGMHSVDKLSRGFSKYARLNYLEWLSHVLTKENARFFLLNYPIITEGISRADKHLNSILDELMSLHYIWDEKSLLIKFLGFLAAMSPLVRNGGINWDPEERNLFNYKFEGRCKVLAPHFYDIFNLINESGSIEIERLCRMILRLYLNERLKGVIPVIGSESREIAIQPGDI